MHKKSRAIPIAVAGLVGATLFLGVRTAQGDPWATAVASKLIGGESPCPWGELLAAPWSLERFASLQTQSAGAVHPVSSDPALGITQYETPARRFWIPDSGRLMDGTQLLAYVLAEQAWLAERAPERMVGAGDVVVDVGAHVGTFGDDALRRGAAKVIMVEPDPLNVECIRRNFADEIASGRVVVVPEGAWSSASTLDFHTGVGNSGNGSFVAAEGEARSIKVSVRPLDAILADLAVDRVDFIKMDIEGAEREALRGAAGTLRRHRPRIMLDAYHLPDDHAVLPAIILGSDAEYSMFCAACGYGRHHADRRLIPYSLFFD